MRQIFGMLLKKNMYTRIFIWYILFVSIIVLFLGTFLYVYFSNKMYKDTWQINAEMLNYLNRSLDELMIKKAEDIITEIVYINKKYEYITRISPRNDMQQVRELIIDLDNFKYMNNFIESIYIFMEDWNTIISTDGCTEIDVNMETDVFLEHYYDLFWLKYYYKMEGEKVEWIPTRLVDKSIINSVKDKYIFTYVKSLNKSVYGDKNVIFAINMAESHLRDIIKSINPKISNYTYIIDQDGNIISSNENNFLENNIGMESIAADINQKQEGYFIYLKSDSKYFVSFTTSKYNGWKYLFMIPYNTIFGSLLFTRNLIITLCIVIWSLAVIVSYFVAKKQYMPINKIIQLIRKLSGFENKGYSTNEYMIITETIEKYYNEVVTLHHRIDESRNIDINNLMNLLISSETNTLGIARKLIDYNICLADGQYFIVLLNVFGNINGNDNRVNIRNIEIIKMFFRKQIGEYTETLEGFSLYSILVDMNNIAFLFNNTESDYSSKLLEDALNKIFTKYIPVSNIDVRIGISSINGNKQTIPILYKEAKESLQQKSINSDNVFFYEGINRNYDISSNEIKSACDDLKKYLNNNDLDGCMMVFHNVLNIIKTNVLSYSIAKNIFKCIAMVIQVYVNEIARMKYNFTLSVPSLLYEFYESDNIIEMQMKFSSLIITIIEQNKSLTKNIRNNEIIEKIIKYIESNVDKDININEIAGILFFSPDYIRQMFKEKTGSTFNEYVTMVRMQKACDLLEMTNSNIGQVAKILNYNSSYYFIRKFKECYGVTPKEYRIQKKLK